MSVLINPSGGHWWKWEAVIVDPVTNQRPGTLSSQHREIDTWLNETMGPQSRYDRWIHYLHDVYLFVNHEDAVMFQLTWS
jgi:hypothetical protein